VRDPDRAAALYRSTCALDEASACAHVESAGPAEGPTSAERYARTCNDDVTTGCAQLGALYLAGKGVAPDAAKALQAFERACSDGDAPACASLGDLYQQGRGTERDAARALTLYDRACSAKVAWACKRAGHLYRQTHQDGLAYDR
jgi:TPR repeat protein